MLILSAGSNACGQLANGGVEDSHHFQPVLWADEEQPTSQVKRIACGGNHTLVLFEDGQLWVSGDGRRGQLGSVKSSHVFTRLLLGELGLEAEERMQILDVTAAWETSYIMVRRRDGGDTLITMGANDFGDCGSGIAGSKGLSPINQVSFDHLFSSNVNPASIRIRNIQAGPHHVIVSLLAKGEDGELEHCVAGWGGSRHGQLGSDDQSKPPISYASPRILTLRHTSAPVAISAGNQHTVLLRSDGQLSGYGSNKKAQLSFLTSPPPNAKAIQCTWNGTCLVSSSSDAPPTLYLSGSNAHGQLGTLNPHLTSHRLQFSQIPTDHRLEQVSAGSEHVLALFKGPSGTVVLGWGWNEHGNLGLGHIEDVSAPRTVWPLEDTHPHTRTRVQSVWAGCGTSFLVLE